MSRNKRKRNWKGVDRVSDIAGYCVQEWFKGGIELGHLDRVGSYKGKGKKIRGMGGNRVQR
jgi:hypothetical protein